MDIINSAIKCVNCLNILSSPVLLPCGHSICKAHTNTNGDAIMCHKCGQQHSSGNYFENEALAAMIAAQIGSLEFGQCHKEAMLSCEQLNNLISQADVLLKDPECYIYDTFSEMRRKVHLKHEEIKLKVDEEAQQILGEINKAECECKESLKSSDNSSVLKRLETERESAQHQLDVYLSSLNELKFDETKWNNIKEECTKNIESLQEMIFDFNNTFSANKIDLDACNLEYFSTINLDLHMCKFKIDSKILASNKMQRDFVKLCEFGSQTKFSLLYRGSRDGFRGKDFHAKCDDKPKTVTIIKSTQNNIFGGYTDVTWGKNGSQYKSDPNAFLFSLVNKENEPIKMKIDFQKKDFAIGNDYFGPIFGGPESNDLVITDNCNLNAFSWSNLGSCFKHPKYKEYSNEANSFLAGSLNFQVNEIEIFQIV